MSKEKQLNREFIRLDKRFNQAKAEAEKHIRHADAWIIIMDDILSKMRRINREIKEAGDD